MRRRSYSNKPDHGYDAGILLVDKPASWTSHDVVSFVRGFGVRKVGHCGTLDPAATGLLVLVLGSATKLTGNLNSQDKIYEGEMCLGIETSTQDGEGKILNEQDYSGVTEEMVHDVCAGFVGAQTQIPPMVSAKKQNGKPLYKLARQGIVVEREPVPIHIYYLSIEKIDLPVVRFSVKCSKGTYIRTLCADIGTLLGCGAHLKSLRRTKSGDFSLPDAHTMSEIKTWDIHKLFENCLDVEPFRTLA